MVSIQVSRREALSLSLVALLAASGCGQPGDRSALGLVVTSLDNPYFIEMVDAAKAAALAPPAMPLNVQAPERGAVDPERQRQLTETLIAGHVSVLMVVPADSTQIVGAVVAANRASVPIIILDNDINREAAAKANAKIAGFIGSDNIAGGALAGDFVKQKLGAAGGEVAILEGIPGVQAAVDRKAGFNQSVGSVPNLRVVASQNGDWDREKGYQVTKAILVAHPNLRALFASNDEMGLGAARALSEVRRQDIVLVGYDATPDGRAAVRAGAMSATIAQQPKEVGRLGVEYAKRLLRGDVIPARTTVPLQVVSNP